MKHLLATLMWFLCPVWVYAAGPLVPVDVNPSTVDLSVYFKSATTTLDYPGQRHDTRTRWLGLSLREKFGSRLTLGMYGGYAWLTQTDNPVTNGQELYGYHAGFSLYGILLEGQRVSLYGVLDYLYQRMDFDIDSQKVVIDWSQPQAQLGLIATVTPMVRIYGAGTYSRIDGEERASGIVTQSLTIDRSARSGALLGIDINVESGGYVGMEARSGLTRGAEIYFKKRF